LLEPRTLAINAWNGPRGNRENDELGAESVVGKAYSSAVIAHMGRSCWSPWKRTSRWRKKPQETLIQSPTSINVIVRIIGGSFARRCISSMGL